MTGDLYRLYPAVVCFNFLLQPRLLAGWRRAGWLCNTVDSGWVELSFVMDINGNVGRVVTAVHSPAATIIHYN